jgi:hypothetical protein
MVRVFSDGVAKRKKKDGGGAEHYHYWATETTFG